MPKRLSYSGKKVPAYQANRIKVPGGDHCQQRVTHDKAESNTTLQCGCKIKCMKNPLIRPWIGERASFKGGIKGTVPKQIKIKLPWLYVGEILPIVYITYGHKLLSWYKEEIRLILMSNLYFYLFLFWFKMGKNLPI